MVRVRTRGCRPLAICERKPSEPSGTPSLKTASGKGEWVTTSTAAPRALAGNPAAHQTVAGMGRGRLVVKAFLYPLVDLRNGLEVGVARDDPLAVLELGEDALDPEVQVVLGHLVGRVRTHLAVRSP